MESLQSLLNAPRLSNVNYTSSIEIKKENITTDTSIELPDEIKSLITGPEYWRKAKTNRYLKLIRDGYMNQLMELADMSLEKRNPANWFAAVCSKANWGRTLDYLKKLSEVTEKAFRVAERIGIDITKFLYKQIWDDINVLRWADEAREIGRNKEKYFAWLCNRERAAIKQ